MEAQIRSTSPQYAALTQPQPLTTSKIQQTILDSDTLLLEYALGPEGSFLFALTQDSLNVYQLPKEAEIDAQAKTLRIPLTTPFPDQLDEISGKFSQMILGQVAAQLGRKRLIIVPDGILNYVPFAALPVPAVGTPVSGSQLKLVDDHEIVYLPSASTLDVLRHEIQGRAPAAALKAAQNAIRKNPLWAAPYYWAAFTLQGEWMPIPPAATLGISAAD